MRMMFGLTYFLIDKLRNYDNQVCNSKLLSNMTNSLVKSVTLVLSNYQKQYLLPVSP